MRVMVYGGDALIQGFIDSLVGEEGMEDIHVICPALIQQMEKWMLAEPWYTIVLNMWPLLWQVGGIAESDVSAASSML